MREEAKRERGDGPQGIETPTVPETATGVRKLQRTLYRQAKRKPEWKVWSLYGEVCRKEVLEAALRQVIINGGSCGVDGEKVEELAKDKEKREQWLTQLQVELRTRTRRTSAVRRVYILKDDGKKRPLGIPTVKDRVVQTAVVMLLLPIFEADFHENSYAYRPKRNAQQAIDAIKVALLSGRNEVVDADLSGYFDTIPHAGLMQLVKRRVSDGGILRLIKGWLRAPIEETDERGNKHMRKNRCGTPQGGVISPLLANLYLDGLDKAVNAGKQMKAVMIRYADDFVVMCRKGQGHEMKRRLENWLENRGLKLNEKKTKIVDFHRDGFEFLGFRLQRRMARRSGRYYPHVEPSSKSCAKLKARIREETARHTFWKEPEEVVKRVNRIAKGWIGYFHYANSSDVFEKMQWQMRRRIRRWLWKKHAKSKELYSEAYCDDQLHNRYGLIRFPLQAKWQHS